MTNTKVPAIKAPLQPGDIVAQDGQPKIGIVVEPVKKSGRNKDKVFVMFENRGWIIAVLETELTKIEMVDYSSGYAAGSNDGYGKGYSAGSYKGYASGYADGWDEAVG